MWFKIHNTEVKISFTFFGLLLLSIISELSELYLYTLISSVLHELVHFLFIILFKSNITYFSLSIFGAQIKREECYKLSFIKESVISLSAPIFNLFIGYITFRFFSNTRIFSSVNIFIGLFNLLPFYSFDGGRGFSYLLRYVFNERYSEIIITLTSVISTIFISALSVYILFEYSGNFTLLIFSVYMILNLVFKQKQGMHI